MGMAGKKQRRELPHETGNYIEFRTLSGPELDEADIEGTRRASEAMKVLPEQVVLQEMAKEREPGAAEKRTADDVFRGYDKKILVRYGVHGWEGPEFASVDCNDESKMRLDARTFNWAARVVFDMNVRPEGEESGSDGSSPKVEQFQTS